MKNKSLRIPSGSYREILLHRTGDLVYTIEYIELILYNENE